MGEREGERKRLPFVAIALSFIGIGDKVSVLLVDAIVGEMNESI